MLCQWHVSAAKQGEGINALFCKANKVEDNKSLLQNKATGSFGILSTWSELDDRECGVQVCIFQHIGLFFVKGEHPVNKHANLLADGDRRLFQ